MQKSRKQDAVIGVVMIALSAFCWFDTRNLAENVNVYTHIVLTITAILGAILTIWSFVKKNESAGPEVAAAEFKNPLVAFIILLVYVFVMGTVGFYFSSALFMVGFAYWMGYRKWVPMVCTTVGMLGFVYILFNVMLKVKLPHGLLF